MAQYHGKNGVVYMAARGTAPSPVLYQTDFTINTAADTDEVTHFQNINKRYVQGIPDMVVSLSGVWDDTDNTLFTLALAVGGVSAYLYPTALNATKYWYGPAWLSVNSVTVGVGGAVKMDGTLSALGDWGRY